VTALKPALESGELTTETLDERVRRALQLLQRTGKFSDRKTTPAECSVDLPEHRALIREAGVEGIVLLKNDDSILPIKKENCKKIALVGPLADYAAAHGGGSASLNCHYKISPLEAMKARFGSDMEISVSKGANIFRIYPALEIGTLNQESEIGWTAEYFKNPDVSGECFFKKPFPRGSMMTVMDLDVVGFQSIRFSTAYTPKKSGSHYISYGSMGAGKLYINDELLFDQPVQAKDSMSFLLGVAEENRLRYKFDASKSYSIRIDTILPTAQNSGLYILDGQTAIHFGLVEQDEMEADIFNEAVAMAKEADYTLIFVGNNMQWETEGQDMTDYSLPADGSQDALIYGVAAVNPKTIVINTTGVAVRVPWLNEVPALLQTWYGGQESGNAVLDVIFGQTCPSGKLPISWPREYEHTGCYGNFGIDSFESAEVEYVEGIYVGYRHFDKFFGTEKEVCFPFGFGLSYTQFQITDSSLTGKIDSTGDDEVCVTMKVKNVGSTVGAESVQVYVVPPKDCKVDRPVKTLAGFEKVLLEPNQHGTLQVKFGKDAFAFWDDEKSDWAVSQGVHQILVATSSSPKDIVATLDLNIVSGFNFGA
jgi:beta-glucosidase